MFPAATNGLNLLAIFFGLGVGIVLFLIGLSFAAFVLKTSCRLVGAEVPDTGKAMIISFLESLCCGVAYIFALTCIWLFGMAVSAHPASISVFAGLSLITLAFVVPAGLYVPMLRVSFPKGMALAVLRYVITLSIFLMFGLAVGMATGRYKMH